MEKLDLLKPEKKVDHVFKLFTLSKTFYDSSLLEDMRSLMAQHRFGVMRVGYKIEAGCGIREILI